MSFFLSPIGNEQQFNANGDPLNGGKVLTYLAGSTTPTATYTDNTGGTAQANPIILNSLGLPASPIWLNGGITYKFVIQDANSVTLRTVDNISGINDTTATQTEWVSSGLVPTFISTVSFSVPGDQTSVLQIGRRLRTQNTAGLIYSRITNSVFGATITTVTVVNDSGVLDSGLSSVSYGLMAPISPSLPNSVSVRDTMGITTALQNQEGIAYTTAGTSTAYTLTPSPAITAYTANQSFYVRFNAASGAAPTLAISGVATPPNLVKQLGDGTYANIAAGDIPLDHRSRVTLLSATQALVEDLPFSVASPGNGQLAGTRNRLINGDMRIDQRNSGAAQTFTAAAALAYSVDRWYGFCTGANVTGQQIAGTAPESFVYRFTGAASVTTIGFAQRIERLNSTDLAGQTATLSVKLSNSLLTSVTWTAYYANTNDTFGSLAAPTRTQIATGTFTVTSTLASYSTQIAVPSAAITGIEIVFSVGAQTSGTWQIGAVQLELGSVATAFERRDLAGELIRCQRYLPIVLVGAGATNGGSLGVGYAQANVTGRVHIKYPVQARVTPTGIITTTVGNFNITNGTGVGQVVTGIAATRLGISGALLAFTVGASLTAGDATELFATTADYIYFTGSEL